MSQNFEVDKKCPTGKQNITTNFQHFNKDQVHNDMRKMGLIMEVEDARDREEAAGIIGEADELNG